jgi:hypothetical protein
MSSPRFITQAEVAEILGEWADRRLSPLVPDDWMEADPGVEVACDALFDRLADDPEDEIADVPPAVLWLAWRRVEFQRALAAAAPDLEAVELLADRPPRELLLRVLLGSVLAGWREPEELDPKSPPPGATRRVLH